YWVVRRLSASPTVPASNSAESRFPAYGRSGVGIITFTGIGFSILLLFNLRAHCKNFESVSIPKNFLFLRLPEKQIPRFARDDTEKLNRSAMTNLDSLGRESVPIIVQAPRGHILLRAMVHADDNVAVPRPGMVL